MDESQLAAAVRTAYAAAVVAVLVVALAGYLVAGPKGLGLALGGGAVGMANLRFAAFALTRAPIAFLGSSLPRLLVITVLLLVVVLLLGPVSIWGVLGLLATYLAEVGIAVRAVIRSTAK
ncbi:MAG: hypothetical protein ACREN7_05035 [Candidatus Dormibacteria bacterium]